LPHDTGAAVGGSALRTKMMSKEQGKDPDGSDRDVILGTIPELSDEGQRKNHAEQPRSSLSSSCHPPVTSSLLGANIFPAIIIVAVVCIELTVLWDVTPCSLVGKVKICFIHH